MVNHFTYKEKSIKGRYVTQEMLMETWLPTLDTSLIKEEGLSQMGSTIFSITLGTGKRKVLLWSQMHGNESTTTKAVLDMVNFLQSDEVLAKSILNNCTLLIIPILNPDGAKLYTRANANGTDLNRDAKELSQPESKVLRKVFEAYRPAYCFNLHDQRTLFSAGKSRHPATVSFLAPASNPERDITPAREISMKIIVAMAKHLNQYIPYQIGRYDDGFNENCVGDTFQMQQVPTILFEAGHYPKDYEREKTRAFIFQSLLRGLEVISKNEIDDFKTSDYFEIPENEKLFYDIIVKNAHTLNPSLNENEVLGITYKEVLNENSILFQPEIVFVGSQEGFFGHESFDCSKRDDFQTISSRQEVLDLILSVKK
ncbi:M14 family metallopeptidase [Flagellimonas sp. HMM57]|uniref:M14 family metallopeptidase n=1 Tax=unclassified Flagellimonas TaxID=2644544 RepID=UPI0013D2EC7C|nr:MULTISPECIES: M14 metallopeptidase family protein [unclassified Flagellimonas]UII75940.1 M14 family metallopeptidase [Flagellimonas sp. HMM57]